MQSRVAVLSLSLLVGTTAVSSVFAQQTTGTPGAPGATTTIDGKQIPPPDPKFGGVINEKASDSKAWWAPRVVPPKGENQRDTEVQMTPPGQPARDDR